jgi:hypothetical protein
MRPIPRTLLIHTATLAQAAADANGNETLTTIAELRRVRVEPDDTETAAQDETKAERTALLLYDAVNSVPRGVTFAVGQRVLYAGARYRVEAVALLHDGRRMHHVEASLRG